MPHRLDLDPEERGRSSSRRPARPWRATTIAIIMVALAGGLWGGYHALGRHASGDAIPILHADDRPIKVAPTDPGGMVVPDQDMYVLNKPHSLDTRVEQILPPPETPLPRPAPPEPEASAAVPAITEDAAPGNAPPVIQTVTPSSVAAPVSPPSAASTPSAASSPPLARVTLPATPLPQVVPAQPAAAPAPLPTVAPPAVAIAPAVPPLPAAPPPRPAPPREIASLPPRASSGDYRIQLGAVHSVEAAQQEWDRLKRLQPELLGRLHADAVRYDLGERGVIYRIQAGPIAGAIEADRLCDSLRQHKLGCLLVKR
jgi:hypothetical protein